MNALPNHRSRFYLGMSLAFLAIALLGFSSTFFIPLLQQRFSAPAVIHLHGLLLFGWLLLLIAQATLVQTRRIGLHRQLGWCGLALGAAIVVSGVAVGLHATRRDLAAGPNAFALGQMLNILIEMALFGGLVAAAVVYRRDRESHKRLLMLATISALAPAWLRLRHLFPMVPNPFVTFSLLADSLLLVAIARDALVLKRVHPVYLWVGSAMVGIHLLEIAAIDSALWQQLARYLVELP
jgi:hypothetical protein